MVTLPAFLEDLKGATKNNSKTITDSPATISAMVKIFANIGRRANSLKITISEQSTKVGSADLCAEVVVVQDCIGSCLGQH